MKQNPKFSIVTTVYNGEKYIEKCILSVMSQSYKNYEHIIVDAGSTDGTIDIIKKYENKYNMRWISEKDEGMYDGINKGFKLATGDIYAWLNSDDEYLPHAFETVATVMIEKNIQWCTGFPVVLTEDGKMYQMNTVLPIYLSRYIKKGYHDGRIAGMIQQESTFWTKELWDKVGGLDKKYKLAGDYWLWRRFAEHEKLYTIDTIIAGFRRHPEQKSANIDEYWNEVGMDSIMHKIFAKFKIIKFIIYMQSLGENKQLIRMRTFWE